MARKTFERGQEVEVYRRIFGDWRPGIYQRPAGTPGCHVVFHGGGDMEFSTRNIRSAVSGERDRSDETENREEDGPTPSAFVSPQAQG